MNIVKYIVIALLTLGVFAPSTRVFAADSTNQVGTADSGKKKDKKSNKDKKPTTKKKKPSDGSTDSTDSGNK